MLRELFSCPTGPWANVNPKNGNSYYTIINITAQNWDYQTISLVLIPILIKSPAKQAWQDVCYLLSPYLSISQGKWKCRIVLKSNQSWAWPAQCACAEWTNQVAGSQIWTNEETGNVMATDRPTDRQSWL